MGGDSESARLGVLVDLGYFIAHSYTGYSRLIPPLHQITQVRELLFQDPEGKDPAKYPNRGITEVGEEA